MEKSILALPGAHCLFLNPVATVMRHENLAPEYNGGVAHDGPVHHCTTSKEVRR